MSRAPVYRAPWGYLRAKDGHFVATTGQAQIYERREIGETAIRLLAALGIGVDQLQAMADIEEPGAMIAVLQEKRAARREPNEDRQLSLPFASRSHQ